MRIYLIFSLLILGAFDAGLFAGKVVRERAEPAFHSLIWRA